MDDASRRFYTTGVARILMPRFSYSEVFFFILGAVTFTLAVVLVIMLKYECSCLPGVADYKDLLFVYELSILAGGIWVVGYITTLVNRYLGP